MEFMKVLKQIFICPEVINPEGVIVTWSSNKPDIISVEGQVTRPEIGLDDEIVKLTAKLELGDQVMYKNFYSDCSSIS